MGNLTTLLSKIQRAVYDEKTETENRRILPAFAGKAGSRYFSLLNIAEESHYLRLRRRQAEQLDHYWPGSFHDTLLSLKESGVTADKLQVLLDELL